MIRPPSCAGSVYPDDPQELRAALDAWLELPARAAGTAAPRAEGQPGEATPERGADRRGARSRRPRQGGEGTSPPSLVVAPHIDFPRGARGYAAAARAFAATDADVYVVFGTAHEGPTRLFTLTRRDYGTPLGAVETDRRAVASLVRDLGEAEALGCEAFHDGEHSVELPLVVLRHVVARPFTVVPVLCASIAHLPEPARLVARFLEALARALRGRRACFVAGADLAHVGPLYGDPAPPTAAEAARVEADDRRTLAFLANGDPEGFRRDALRDDARRRLCGTAPIYAAMRAAGRGARVLHYSRWTDGVDSVSFAAAAG